MQQYAAYFSDLNTGSTEPVKEKILDALLNFAGGPDIADTRQMKGCLTANYNVFDQFYLVLF